MEKLVTFTWTFIYTGFIGRISNTRAVMYLECKYLEMSN